MRFLRKLLTGGSDDYPPCLKTSKENVSMSDDSIDQPFDDDVEPVEEEPQDILEDTEPSDSVPPDPEVKEEPKLAFHGPKRRRKR